MKYWDKTYKIVDQARDRANLLLEAADTVGDPLATRWLQVACERADSPVEIAATNLALEVWESSVAEAKQPKPRREPEVPFEPPEPRYEPEIPEAIAAEDAEMFAADLDAVEAVEQVADRLAELTEEALDLAPGRLG